MSQEFQFYDVMKFSSEVTDNLGTYYNIPKIISQILVYEYGYMIMFYEMESLASEDYYKICKGLDARLITPKIMALMFKWNHGLAKYSSGSVSNDMLLQPISQINFVKIKKDIREITYCDKNNIRIEEFWFKAGESKEYDYHGFVFEPSYKTLDKYSFSALFTEYFADLKDDQDYACLQDIDTESADFYAIQVYDDWDLKACIVSTNKKYFLLQYAFPC